MNELTLVIDSWNHKELPEYLLSLKGVLDVQIEDDKNLIVYIKYDSLLTSIKLLKTETLLFLDALNVPSIVGFDKHCKNETKVYELVIKDLCCEYCLKGMIDDLLFTDGIEKANCNIENIDDMIQNGIINIIYDYELISDKKIKEIELKFNS